MFYQIPDFPASDNYPLFVTLIIYTLVLLGAFGSLLRYFIKTVKEISSNFTKSLEKLVAQNEKQTTLLLEIKQTVSDIDEKTGSASKAKRKRGL